MLASGYVDEFEVKKEDGGDPSVDRGVRLNVGVAKHTLDVTCIHFDNEIADSDEMMAGGTERAEEPALKFELRLGVTRLAFVPRGNRSVMAGDVHRDKLERGSNLHHARTNQLRGIQRGQWHRSASLRANSLVEATKSNISSAVLERNVWEEGNRTCISRA